MLLITFHKPTWDITYEKKYHKYSPLFYAVIRKQFKLAEYFLKFLDDQKINSQCSFENSIACYYQE